MPEGAPLQTDDAPVFDYVVERKPPAAICFGSKLQRNTGLIGKGLSPFQKREVPEINPVVGPGYYSTEKYNGAMDKLLKNVTSTRGAGPLASGDPRYKEKMYMRTPSPTRYSTCAPWTTKRRNKVAFNSKSKRLVLKDDKLPGPGCYNIHLKKCRKTRFMYNLGHPTMIPSIEVICVSRPTHTCIKCEQICVGDYWHKDHTTFLCHLCWEEERRGGELYNKKELLTLQKIRNCSFAHSHEGTTAAIRLLSPKKITKKLRIENYLDLYIKC